MIAKCPYCSALLDCPHPDGTEVDCAGCGKSFIAHPTVVGKPAIPPKIKPLIIKCPHCFALLECPHPAGTVVDCAGCGKSFVAYPAVVGINPSPRTSGPKRLNPASNISIKSYEKMVAARGRCSKCNGNIELWQGLRRCSQCGEFDMPKRNLSSPSSHSYRPSRSETTSQPSAEGSSASETLGGILETIADIFDAF